MSPEPVAPQMTKPPSQLGSRAAQNPGNVEAVLYGAAEHGFVKTVAQKAEQTLVFLVELVAELFEQHDGVGIETRMLPRGHD